MILENKIFISTVSTGRSGQLRKIFEPFGATIVDFPMIRIETSVPEVSDIQILGNLERFDWIVFTSSHGVLHFFKLLKMITGSEAIPGHLRLATIGKKTAEELEKAGRPADYISSGNTSEDLAEELKKKVIKPGAEILLSLGNMAPSLLTDLLSEKAFCTRVNVYDTHKCEPEGNDPVEMIRKDNYSMILITSPSAAIYLSDKLISENIPLNVRAASIGIVTTSEAERLGINCLVTASLSTYEGLAQKISDYYLTN